MLLSKVLLRSSRVTVASRSSIPSLARAYSSYKAKSQPCTRIGSVEDISKVGVVGCGVIGMSWAFFYISKGLKVVAMDPDPTAEMRLIAFFENARAAYSDNDIDLVVDLNLLTFTTEVNDAFHEVDFIQANGPENLAIKQSLLQLLEKHIKDDVIIASSSSGLHISDYQRTLRLPGRVLLGHPFNPPHLIPLVEVCAGKLTDEANVQKAINFYQALGKKPVRLNKEITGHIANRIQAAVLREVFYLLTEDVASLADIDKAVSNGPGLRWALMGQFMTFNLGGGEGGIRHLLEHLGRPIESWWADLGHIDKITPELINAAAGGIKREMAKIDSSQVALQRARDKELVKIVLEKGKDPILSQL